MEYFAKNLQMKFVALVVVCFCVGALVLYAVDCVIAELWTSPSREYYQDDPQIADKVGDDE